MLETSCNLDNCVHFIASNDTITVHIKYSEDLLKNLKIIIDVMYHKSLDTHLLRRAIIHDVVENHELSKVNSPTLVSVIHSEEKDLSYLNHFLVYLKMCFSILRASFLGRAFFIITLNSFLSNLPSGLEDTKAWNVSLT